MRAATVLCYCRRARCRAPPERVYRAFTDADAMAKWLPPHGFTGRVHDLDARVGGTFRMSFTNFSSGQSHSFGGEYLDLVPNERLRYTDRFDDPNLPGVMTTGAGRRTRDPGLNGPAQRPLHQSSASNRQSSFSKLERWFSEPFRRCS
ncbi:MAG: hypothetical protein FIB04_05890 [Gammaproteobacteria bacterium]|nr:hypothetical protein [Gammaproteobacteria bacterium]